VRDLSIWRQILGVDAGVIIEGVRFEKGQLVARVRPHGVLNRPSCPHCGCECGWYDRGGGLRRWRGLDINGVQVFLEADAPRIFCPRHGVLVAAVPWARHRSGFTRGFEDTVAWLARQCSKTAVTELMRVTWRTVGNVLERVAADLLKGDRLDGLRRIGIDEVSYRKGHRYLTVVVDHDTNRLIWAADGRDSATLERFFAELGPERSAKIELVSADGANWIKTVVNARCGQAALCLDPFHIVKWATDALDEVRRQVWNKARKAGEVTEASDVKGARFALWKKPEDLTEGQKQTLASIAKVNGPLYRAYLLKEELRAVFKATGEAAKSLLDKWIDWAQRCQLAPFVKVQKTLKENRAAVDAVLTHRLTNARVESMNTKIRVITRRAFGFHGPQALISLAMLTLGGVCPTLPGR